MRGTWPDTSIQNPETVGRPVVQLYQPPDGKTHIRAAVLLPYSRQQVWSIVTDYEHYDRFLPYLDEIEVSRQKDGCHMKGEAKSAVSGYWSFAIDIHEHKTDKDWSTTWDQTGGKEVAVNRGGWTLVDRGKDQTLLVLALEAEVKGYPTFLLRNVFMHRLPKVLQAVEERLKKDHPE